MLVGAAISVYQHFGVCGCDMEETQGAMHVAFYEWDLDMARGLGLDAIRTGVEWGLVEHVEGRLNTHWVEFYRRYLSRARELGLAVWATLHHFTNPPWIHRYGGWTNRRVARAYVRYVDRVLAELGDLIDVAVLFNEPSTYALLAYIHGVLPPHHQLDLPGFRRALDNILEAVAEARDVARGYGITTSATHMLGAVSPRGLTARLAAKVIEWLYMREADALRVVDILGVNIYVVTLLRGLRASYVAAPQHVAGAVSRIPGRKAITEAGIATRDHTLKEWYMCMLARSLPEVEAVFWWSLLHGYEWGIGYKPFFALIDVLRDYTRVVTPPARKYASIMRERPACAERPMPMPVGDWRTGYA